jgi:hypothetical protein
MFGVITASLLLVLTTDTIVWTLIIRRLSGVATCDGGTQPGQRLMLGFALSLLCLRLVSVVLGGYGIFCLIMSFYVPSVGADAFVLLSTATAIFFLCRSG